MMRPKLQTFLLRSFVLAFTVTSLSLAVVSCDSNSLDVDDPNRLTPENFWRNAEDAKKGVIACYGPLTTIQGWGRMMGAIHTIHRGDIVDVNPQPNVYDTGTFTVGPSLPRLEEPWGELFAIVARANQVLANVPDIDMEQDLKDRYLGEAHFLRGLAYFYLVNMWRNVPLYTSAITNPDDVNIGQAEPAEVWSTVKSDFENAQSLLPETVPDGEAGRATRGAATAMLGKSHLYNEEWADAAEEFRKVIDSGIYELTDNYGENFSREHLNNEESVFELQYESTPNGSWGRSGTENPMRGQAWEPDIAPPGFTSQQSVNINDWVFELFMEDETVSGDIDPRAFETLLWDYSGAKVYQTTFDDAFSGDAQDEVYVRKYLNFERESSLVPGSWAWSNNNYRMVRFADVLLMYAEAKNEADGPSGEVYTALNRVRRRADMPDVQSGLSQAELRTEIREERVRELALEGHRAFDLLRWGIMADRFINNPELRENAGMNFERNKNEILPIPQNDIDSNPKFEQNPGY
ncbi:MAG: RagB/SusD family nutrient uptake outer membrane protein [Salinivenus sp.]